MMTRNIRVLMRNRQRGRSCPVMETSTPFTWMLSSRFHLRQPTIDVSPYATSWIPPTRRAHRPLLRSAGESPPAARALFVESLGERHEGRRLRKRHDRLERQRGAVCVVPVGDATNRVPSHPHRDCSLTSRSGDCRPHETCRQRIGSWNGADFQTVPVSTP